jgi:hypothetical protein
MPRMPRRRQHASSSGSKSARRGGDTETVTILQIPSNLGGDLVVIINCPLAPEELQGEKAAHAAYHPESSVILRFYDEILQHPIRLDAFGEAGDTGTIDNAARIALRRTKRRQRYALECHR